MDFKKCLWRNPKNIYNSFKEIINYSAELSWKKHKYENANLYKNVFGKITAEIQKNDSIHESLNNLGELLTNMEKVLEDKYEIKEIIVSIPKPYIQQGLWKVFQFVLKEDD